MLWLIFIFPVFALPNFKSLIPDKSQSIPENNQGWFESLLAWFRGHEEPAKKNPIMGLVGKIFKKKGDI